VAEARTARSRYTPKLAGARTSSSSRHIEYARTREATVAAHALLSTSARVGKFAYPADPLESEPKATVRLPGATSFRCDLAICFALFGYRLFEVVYRTVPLGLTPHH